MTDKKQAVTRKQFLADLAKLPVNKDGFCMVHETQAGALIQVKPDASIIYKGGPAEGWRNDCIFTSHSMVCEVIGEYTLKCRGPRPGTLDRESKKRRPWAKHPVVLLAEASLRQSNPKAEDDPDSKFV